MKFKPENYIKAVKKTPQLKDMGIVEKDSKYDIIASEFIKYCMTRIAVHQNEEEFWFYNYKTQQYEQLSDSRIRKVFFNMICEPNDNIWNAAIEKKYIDYFRRYVTEFQTTGYEPGILQFTNGILEFCGEEVTFAKASPKYFCQFRLPYEYHEDAECPQLMDFLDAIHYHVRSEGQIVKKAVYIAIGIDTSGKKDVLGMWVGENESAKFWANILNSLRNRGVEDILIACTDRVRAQKRRSYASFHKIEGQYAQCCGIFFVGTRVGTRPENGHQNTEIDCFFRKIISARR